MKTFLSIITLIFALASQCWAEQAVLARVTVYWTGESGPRACSNGARLRAGDCAVDPKKIPFGSKVIFPDRACAAVDTGPAVVSRKAARLCGRTPNERSAIVIDRFFESKQEALAWTKANPHFMTVKVITPAERKNRMLAANTLDLPARSTGPPAPMLNQPVDLDCGVGFWTFFSPLTRFVWPKA